MRTMRILEEGPRECSVVRHELSNEVDEEIV